MPEYFTTRGSVRGGCGHRHRTEAAARACAAKDGRDVAHGSPGSYSDRRVIEVGRTSCPGRCGGCSAPDCDD